MNPRILVTLDFLEEKDKNVTNLILQYNSDADACFLYLYHDNKHNGDKIEGDKKLISFRKFIDVLDFLLDIELSLGTDFKTLYTKDHREIKYLRLILPSCVLSIDYKDASFTDSCEEVIVDNIREKFFKIERV